MVSPGRKLSLQKHYHRAEHWVVVNGTALVTRDDETMIVRENESVYLPLGCVHRLENPGKIPLTLIEVQSGAYLGEDDIVRLRGHLRQGVKRAASNGKQPRAKRLLPLPPPCPARGEVLLPFPFVRRFRTAHARQ